MVEIDYAGEVKAGLQYPFKVIAEQGVAIRQSAVLVRTFMMLEGGVTIEHNGFPCDARSILNILMQGFRCGSHGKLTFEKSQSASVLRLVSDVISIQAVEEQ